MEQSSLYSRKNCPVCNHPEFTSFLKCKDHTVSGEWFPVVSCKNCGFKFSNPIPGPADIGRYYASEDYISHSDTKRGLVARAYHFVRKLTLRRKLTLISRFTKKGRLLDFGCGTGSFLGTCKEQGWSVCGLEPDPGARKIAGSRGSVYADLNSLREATPGLFNVITLWHVLEHVYELPETLSFFRDHLDPAGALFIAVPNYRAYDAEVYGESWAAYDVPRHLYHFDRDSLPALLRQYGFTLKEVLPMAFDSYYVSILSEKYVHGKISYPAAFMNGLRSNFKARRSGEYSSLIYVFQLTP